LQTKEYTTADKTNWGVGEWQNEFDKKQWQDLDTGLPCLIVRSPMGALCGYVGVDKNHPLYAKHYDDADVRVHGGLTFASGCQNATPGEYLPEYKEIIEKHGVESIGVCHVVEPGEEDAVWWFGFDCNHFMDYAPKMMITMREAAEAHSKTYPESTLKMTAGDIIYNHRTDIYRDVSYVTEEVTSLARQLNSKQWS
jgi:hypothetical protein